jgi:hypothetical protein
MEQFRAPVLSTGTLGAGVVTQTLTWGYRNYVGGTPDPITSYLGPVIATVRGTPTEIKFTNNLPYPGSAFPGDGSYNAAFFYWGAVDQTLHWADPNDLKCAEQVVANTPPAGPCATPYDGQTYGVPAVPHLHGGEIPPVLDGGRTPGSPAPATSWGMPITPRTAPPAASFPGTTPSTGTPTSRRRRPSGSMTTVWASPASTSTRASPGPIPLLKTAPTVIQGDKLEA